MLDLALFLMVMGTTSHLMSVLPLPAFGVFVLLTDAGAVLRSRLWTRAVLLIALGPGRVSIDRTLFGPRA